MLSRHTKLTKYLFALFLLVVLGYAYFEARNVIFGPQINIHADSEAISVSSERIEITGAAENVVEITLDGREIFVDDSGRFSEVLLLAPGINRFIFEARDKFGNTTQEVFTVVYQPKDQPESQPEQDAATPQP